MLPRSLFGLRVAVRLAAGTILFAAGTPALAQVTLSVGADTVMIDEGVEISISGLLLNRFAVTREPEGSGT